MKDLTVTAEGTAGEGPEITNETASPDKKKKNIEELIEAFNRDNPAKKQKKIYRGVF